MVHSENVIYFVIIYFYNLPKNLEHGKVEIPKNVDEIV